MKTFAQIATITTLLVATSVSISLAAPTKMAAMSKKSAAPATLKCPACGMAMTKGKTPMTTVAVYSKANKKVYYCCPACKAGKAAAAYDKKHKSPMPV